MNKDFEFENGSVIKNVEWKGDTIRGVSAPLFDNSTGKYRAILSFPNAPENEISLYFWVNKTFEAAESESKLYAKNHNYTFKRLERYDT